MRSNIHAFIIDLKLHAGLDYRIGQLGHRLKPAFLGTAVNLSVSKEVQSTIISEAKRDKYFAEIVNSTFHELKF